MAVIGRKVALSLLACAVAGMRADQASQVRSQLEIVAAALTAGNPAEAMSAFDKSYPNYDKLSNYFGGLTSGFQIVNEVDVTEEEDSAAEIKAAAHWTVTLSDLGTNYTERRVGDINLRLVLKDRKWKIVEFAPIEIFDPQPKAWPKVPGQKSLSK